MPSSLTGGRGTSLFTGFKSRLYIITSNRIYGCKKHQPFHDVKKMRRLVIILKKPILSLYALFVHQLMRGDGRGVSVTVYV
jgi:hypothetical protein